MLTIGSYRAESAADGLFGLDGGAMFGIVPRPLWEKKLPPDERNRIPLGLNPLLLRGAGRVILVDVGMGERWSDKKREIFDLRREKGGLIDSLAEKGVSPEEVTDVIPSHLHFDHAGGLTRHDADGRATPVFPNATVHIQTAQWNRALSPTIRDRGSYRHEDWSYLDGDSRLRLLDGDGEVLPGISARVWNGHTPGMQTVHIHGDDRDLVFAADVVPTSAHLPPAWHMSYDVEPVTAIEEKTTLVREALEQGWYLYFVHDPQLTACVLEDDERSMVKVSKRVDI